jgi:hypothetical protein
MYIYTSKLNEYAEDYLVGYSNARLQLAKWSANNFIS